MVWMCRTRPWSWLKAKIGWRSFSKRTKTTEKQRAAKITEKRGCKNRFQNAHLQCFNSSTFSMYWTSVHSPKSVSVITIEGPLNTRFKSLLTPQSTPHHHTSTTLLHFTKSHFISTRFLTSTFLDKTFFLFHRKDPMSAALSSSPSASSYSGSHHGGGDRGRLSRNDVDVGDRDAAEMIVR